MDTPIRRQYLELKRRHPHALLFFRLGDFYETFDDDALVVARELEITLTGREMGRGRRVPLAGVPHQSLETHLARLIRRGYKVAIAEQLTDPGTTKGLVRRDIVRVVTPGTVVEPGILADRENNYLVALIQRGDRAGLAYVDVSTGEFRCTEFGGGATRATVAAELRRLRPAELLVPETQTASLDNDDEAAPAVFTGQHVSPLPDWFFGESDARLVLQEQFDVAALEGFGCAQLPLAIAASGAVIQYLRLNQRPALILLRSLLTYHVERYMLLDEATLRNLAVWNGPSRDGARPGLLALLDRTSTSMGARLLRRRLGQPLIEVAPLRARQALVTALAHDGELRRRLRALLVELPDLERLSGRLTTLAAGPRELGALRAGLAVLPHVVALSAGSAVLAPVGATIPEFGEEVATLHQALVDEPPSALGDIRTIRPGFAPEIDAIDASAQEARAWVAGLETAERRRTGIKGLKIGFNRVFGYYLEISNANRMPLPPEYQRKQSLSGAERYTTRELKDREAIILHAQERLRQVEAECYQQLVAILAAAGSRLLAAATAVAELDVAAGLAEAAAQQQWVCPDLEESTRLVVRDGRHPIVEAALPSGKFVSNDLTVDAEDNQVLIVTGPNMAGKSTYLRQAALIVLMAQIGSYVPATAAIVGLADRIFTRIGAHDDLAKGQSTFLVEMLELANLLNQATPRSLVILDEVGRGTSTYDGLAIARAVVEHLHNAPNLGCRTLFATHYHELTELADSLPRVRNYNVAVDDQGERIAFLHRIVPGGASRSYGIHVARRAGVPRAVTHRAEELLLALERNRLGRARAPLPSRQGAAEQGSQLSLFADVGHAEPGQAAAEGPVAPPAPSHSITAARRASSGAPGDEPTPSEAQSPVARSRRMNR